MLQQFKFNLPVSSNLTPSLLRHYVMSFYNAIVAFSPRVREVIIKSIPQIISLTTCCDKK